MLQTKHSPTPRSEPWPWLRVYKVEGAGQGHAPAHASHGAAQAAAQGQDPERHLGGGAGSGPPGRSAEPAHCSAVRYRPGQKTSHTETTDCREPPCIPVLSTDTGLQWACSSWTALPRLPSGTDLGRDTKDRVSKPRVPQCWAQAVGQHGALPTLPAYAWTSADASQVLWGRPAAGAPGAWPVQDVCCPCALFWHQQQANPVPCALHRLTPALPCKCQPCFLWRPFLRDHALPRLHLAPNLQGLNKHVVEGCS